ncbi:methyltransferase type 11 [Grosmannia clavigera kw1407]|uniref:Methyltransferase type 11 n=1 Tax=Grosmannia clavigera (strain kw1407 / UAMH 11150) TaxID=655863 RepID=F0XJK7_GROCL|nr:methyltransferase type 11 [Grosmannia clavigera kw1407]EFX02114.1 methyltransferase type 11 [Grosmannia clavigera kw1407]
MAEDITMIPESSIGMGPNDDRQNTSLDIGHHALTMLMDDKLYLAPLPEHIDKAIDIGTGTGIWAIQIDDFSKPWTFDENSVDYVHVRWLSGCVQDWTKLFKEAFRVLKPGGYIESCDFDSNVSSDDGSVNEKMALSQWGHIYTEGTKKLGFPMSFHPVGEGRQHNGLRDAGFVDITEKSYKVSRRPCYIIILLLANGFSFHFPNGRKTSGYIKLEHTLMPPSPTILKAS